MRSAFVLVAIVERARKCLDFAATVYLFHFVLTCWFGGFPVSLAWWIVHALALIAMTLLGEYLCMRYELREIPRQQLAETV